MNLDYLAPLLLFAGCCTGLGLGALRLAPRRAPLDTALLAPVVGLGALPPLLFAMRLAHLPMRWWIVLGVAAAAAGAALALRRPPRSTEEPAPGSTPLAWIAAIAALGLFALLVTGAMSYPWLEDDDPWQHAVGAHFVARLGTVVQPAERVSQYLEPYPPYFTALMGLLHQLTPQLQWTLKFFNALIAGLSLIPAFFAFERIGRDPRRAAAATVILGILPAYMSHFIWSQTLAVPVFFTALWACAVAADRPSRGAFALATLLVWSATIIQPSTAAVFAMMLVIYAAAEAVGAGRAGRALAGGPLGPIVAGGVLSGLTWAFAIARYGWTRFASTVRVEPEMFAGQSNADTSGGIVYGLGEFLFPGTSGKIDQGHGLGWLASALVVIAVLIPFWNRPRREAMGPVYGLMLAWLVLGLLGVEGNALPVRLFPHRFWIFLAIPVAFLAAEAIVAFAEFARSQRARATVIATGVALVVLTSWEARVGLQQALWMPGVAWTDDAEVVAFVELRKLPAGTRAFSVCGDQRHVIGLNLDAEPWNERLMAFQSALAGSAPVDLARFMRSERYEYAMIGRRCLKLGPERLAAIQDAVNHDASLEVVKESAGGVLVRLREAR